MAPPIEPAPPQFWNLSPQALCEQLQCGSDGLTDAQVQARRAHYGPNAEAAAQTCPWLPTQILLNNLLYDFSEIGIPFDSVPPEAIRHPQVWDMKDLLRFTGTMGPLSSLFDLATFGGLRWLFHASPEAFRTLWFMESMATQILVIFIVRTHAKPWRDAPHPALLWSSLGALAVAMALPFTAVGAWFGFLSPPLGMVAGMGALVLAYLLAAQWFKARMLCGHRTPAA